VHLRDGRVHHRRREVAARYDKALASLDGLEPLRRSEAADNIYRV
jgi:hypothetical protein